MKVVGYVRVSTERQAEQGLGLSIQEQAIRRWVKQGDHRLVTIFRDEGISGSNGVHTRLGLHDALQAIQNGKAQGLVIYKLDRLARALTVQEATLAQVWKHGGRVFAVDIGEVHQDDPDDPMRTAMRQMVGVFAQLERGMIAARMRAGRDVKKANGGYAYGAPGYGSSAQDGVLVEHAAEQVTLERIRMLADEGLSTRQIAAVLTSEGHKPKRAETWQSSTIAGLLRRLKAQIAT